MRGSLGYDLLQKVKDGKINGKELETFLFRNKTVLEKYGLTDEFSDLKKAQALVDDVAKVSDQFEKSIAGRLLGGKTGRPVDSDKVISSILASNRTAADMRQALALVKSDPSAVKGLKKSFSQWVSDNAETTWKQLESNKATISQAKFTQDMKKAREAANVLYADDPEKINALQTMQRAYEIASRSSRAPAGVNSASAEKFVNIVAQNGRRLAVGSSKIAQAADHFWQFIKARSQGKIDEVIAQAIYDPDYAEMLVKGSRGRINPDDLEAVVGGKLIRLDDYRKPRLSQAMVGTAAQNQQGD
jgi:hypothetical protein